MTAADFYKTALIGEDGRTVDVRSFGGSQAEAVDTYLQDIVRKVEDEGLSLPRERSIVVLCDRGTCFRYSTLEYFRKLWKRGFPLGIRELHESKV